MVRAVISHLHVYSIVLYYFVFPIIGEGLRLRLYKEPIHSFMFTLAVVIVFVNVFCLATGHVFVVSYCFRPLIYVFLKFILIR